MAGSADGDSMALDKAAVAHIAALAHIRLGEAELEPLAQELSQILNWVEQLSEVDTADVAPMTSVVATTLPMRDDEVTDGDRRDAILGQRSARTTGGLLCRAQGDRVTALTALTLAEARDGLARKAFLRARAGPGPYRGGRGGAAAQRLYHRDPGARARNGRGRRRAARARRGAAARRHPDRGQGSRSAPRAC